MDPSKEDAGSDEELMTAIAAGDQRAFRVLVERHQGLVIGTVTRMIGAGDAEDLAQQVFLKGWNSAPRWRPEAKVTTWIMTVAKRLVFNESRRRKRSRIIPQASEEETTHEASDESPGPDARLLEGELHEAIGRAMSLLNEKERMAVVLRRHEGMQYEEIAVILGTSVSSVKSLLFRARTTLREKLAPYLEG